MSKEKRNIDIIKDPDGNKIVFINDVIFKGRKRILWDDVERYLRKYVGKFYEIAETKEIVYIGSDLPDEYCHSIYTKYLNRQQAKAKANAIQAIPEIVEISTKKKFSINKKEKHRKKAKLGWYRYESRFAIPIYDDNNCIARYNIYSVEVLIRKEEGGKMYLYDLINVTREADAPFES